VSRFGDQDGVFPLGGKFPVPGDHCPTVAQLFYVLATGVHHGFDGEGHSREHLGARSAPAIMEYLGFFVEAAADAVTAVLPYHGVAVGFHVALDGFTNIAKMGAGAYHVDTLPHGLVGNVTQSFSKHRRLPDTEHLAGIAMIAVFDDGDVDIDDVSLLQFLLTRDAVAHLVIYRGTDGFGKTVVVERCGDRFLNIDDIVVTESVQFGSGDTHLYMRFNHLQHFGGETSGHAHLFDLFRGFYGDGHSVSMRQLYH